MKQTIHQPTNTIIPVYTSICSAEIHKYIELEHFVTLFQELYKDNLISKVYIMDGKVIAVDVQNDLLHDII